MSNVVFILGAGASQQCGAPLMNNFLDKAKDLWNLNKVKDRHHYFQDVFKAIASLQAVHSKSQLDLNNIESIFTAFEIANILKKLPHYTPEKIPELIKALKEVIVGTLEQTIEIPLRANGVQAPKPYGEFSDLLSFIIKEAKPSRDISILTFNYDIALDLALHLKGLEYQYALENEKIQKGFPLLKLHGSLNWAYCSICGQVIPWHFRDYLNKYGLHSFYPKNSSGELIANVPGKLMIGTQLINAPKHCSADVLPSPVIVPPSWNKADQHQTLSNVWSKAAYELETAEYIFIIGYSLPETDAFFKLLFGLGTLGDVPLREIRVYNPDGSGLVKTRFEKMLGPGAMTRFSYNQFLFEQAIDEIKNIFK